ncbi:MAG: PAAR domain-containing protein [Planctomycetaceae bacterium]
MLPAARITDMHTCPMWTGVVPHVGGPIMPPGGPTVLIGGMPAARMGDMVTCVGPPDTIASGVPTVLIGGKPAARMTDLTAHGGVIMAGCPTVLIGGAAPPAPPPPPPPPDGMTPEEVEFMKQGNSEADLQKMRDEKK